MLLFDLSTPEGQGAAGRGFMVVTAPEDLEQPGKNPELTSQQSGDHKQVCSFLQPVSQDSAFPRVPKKKKNKSI